MKDSTPGLCFARILISSPPDASAWVTGNQSFPELSGSVKFYFTPHGGTLVMAEFFGLPDDSAPDSSAFYGMHIHETGNCTPPFENTGNHYNPSDQQHPYHAGDLVPLLGNQGYAWTAFFDKRIEIPGIIGRSVVVHRLPDDFSTQPSGNSGMKIACGVIR